MIGLSSCAVAGGGDPPGQRVHRWADDPFVAEPVACQLKQHAGRVVFQCPGEEEDIELLAITGAGCSPPEPSEHECPMVASGAALPAAVSGQHAGHVIADKIELRGEAIDLGRGQAVRSSGIQPSHGSVQSWSAAPSRFSTRTFEPSQPRSSLVNVKNVTRSSSATPSGQLLSLASSASDRTEPA